MGEMHGFIFDEVQSKLIDRTRIIELPGPPTELPFYVAGTPEMVWLREVKNHFLRLPPGFRRVVGAAGAKIVLAQQPPDLGLVNDQPDPRDFYHRSDIEVPGFYSPKEKTIFMTRQQFNHAAKSYRNVEYAAQITAHEFMHAMDDVMAISSQPGFQNAYQMDAATLKYSWRTADRFGYQLQSGHCGYQEALAEIADELWTGKTISGHSMLEFWPYLTKWTVACFADLTETLDVEVAKGSDHIEQAAAIAEKAVLQHVITCLPYVVKDILEELYPSLNLMVPSKYKFSDYPNGILYNPREIKYLVIKDTQRALSMYCAHLAQERPNIATSNYNVFHCA